MLLCVLFFFFFFFFFRVWVWHHPSHGHAAMRLAASYAASRAGCCGLVLQPLGCCQGLEHLMRVRCNVHQETCHGLGHDAGHGLGRLAQV